MRGCLVHCSTFSSISVLYPLDANNNPPPVVTRPHRPPPPKWSQMSPCGAEGRTKSLSLRNTGLKNKQMNDHQIEGGKRKRNRNESKGSQRKFLLPSMETVNLDPCTEVLTVSCTHMHNRYIGWRPIKRPPEAPLAKVKMCFWMMAQPPTSLEIFWGLLHPLS